MPEDRPQLFLTNEQIHRLAGLACDALAGIQFESTDDQDSPVSGRFVHIDSPQNLTFFTIDRDGSWQDQT